jgi:DNA-binding HxlR family transcriptional regulator
MSEGYSQHFCPITRGAEIFATRWTPLIVRNLLLGCSTFSELQEAAPGIPRSLLTDRLRQLEQASVIQRRPKPSGRGWLYELTDAGRDLGPVCDALGAWGQKWLEASPQKLDPGVLLWAISKSMDVENLPPERVVVRFEFVDQAGPKRRYWLLVQQPEPEVCRKPPGFEEDLLVKTSTEPLARWHMGEISLGQAMHTGTMSVEGPRYLVSELSKWGGITPFAAGSQPRAS